DIVFGRGIDRVGDLVQVAADVDVVQKSGSWYSFGEVRLGQGKEKAVELLATRPDLADEIRTKVYDVLKVTGGKVPASPAQRVEVDEEESSALEA
ncbi:MAG TPA: hypothetical protein VFN03_10035, partial [Trueperaceae bacterium]|nr:hypothetical protein [Trueperaceae bacterium]